MSLYENAAANTQRHFMTRHLVILALFSDDGGNLILYPPGEEALQAPSVTIRCQLYRSVGHSALSGDAPKENANMIVLGLRRLRRSLRLRGSSNGRSNLTWTSRGHFLLRSLSPPLICSAPQIHRHLNPRLGPGTSSAMIRTLLAVRALKALPRKLRCQAIYA
jgi:hypothetical protein